MNYRLIKHLATALLFAAMSMGSVPSAHASLLTPAFQSQLETWLGQGPLSFTNIYAGTTGGLNFNSTDWHSAVDGQGATFTLIEVPAGTYYSYDPSLGLTLTTIDRSIIGGYNPQSWNSSNGYNITGPDAERTAFIYNLSTSILLRQILSTDPDTYAAGNIQTYNSGSYGPTFGGGHDLYTAHLFSEGYAFPYSYGTTYGPGLFGTTGSGPYWTGYLHGFSLVNLETYTFSTTEDVPEPSTIALIGMALLSLFGFGMMRRRADA